MTVTDYEMVYNFSCVSFQINKSWITLPYNIPWLHSNFHKIWTIKSKNLRKNLKTPVSIISPLNLPQIFFSVTGGGLGLDNDEISPGSSSKKDFDPGIRIVLSYSRCRCFYNFIEIFRKRRIIEEEKKSFLSMFANLMYITRSPWYSQQCCR